MDFSMAQDQNNEVKLSSPKTLHATVRAAAFLDEIPDMAMQTRPYDQKPYWSVERARVGKSREVDVELVVNGIATARKRLLADGVVRNIEFDQPIEKSSWVAIRIPYAAHTNPIFVIVDGKPIRASKASAEWALTAVHQCWTQKAPRISDKERAEARSAYDTAEATYRRLARECGQAK